MEEVKQVQEIQQTLIRQKKEEYAAFLRDVANHVENSQGVPAAIMCQIYWYGTEVSQAEKKDHGFNTLTAAGMLLRMASQYAMGAGQLPSGQTPATTEQKPPSN